MALITELPPGTAVTVHADGIEKQGVVIARRMNGMVEGDFLAPPHDTGADMVRVSLPLPEASLQWTTIEVCFFPSSVELAPH